MLVFLFTDIEGSTRLWEEYTDVMGEAIARHDAILQQQIEASGGRITKHTGDGVTAAFEGGDPVTCAVETQVQFAAVDWGAIGELRIRVGLHAGEAEFHASAGTPEGDYFGPPVNATARVMSAAWGGQVLLTPEVTQVSPLPPGATLRDLGEHLLKNVSAPQQLYQLDHPQLARREFPPPRTLSGQSIRQAVDEGGSQLAGLDPTGMAVGLLTAILVPALQGELDPESGALEGNLGVLGDLGAGTLRAFTAQFARRLRARQQAGESPGPFEIQALLGQELLAQWQAGGDTAAALRADASRLLQAVQGVDAALQAATAEVKDALARGLADLGGTFAEFRWMLDGLQETLSEIRTRQAVQLGLQREQLDLQREQLVKTNLLIRYQQERAAVAVPVVPLVEGEGYEDLPPADVPCPYKGLAAFEADDAEYFFGRQELVAELTARLAGTRFLAVVGPSGSGKSSLVKAGLLPAIWQDGLPGSKDWQTLVLTPGAHPLEEMAVRVSLLRGVEPSSLLEALQSRPQALHLAVKQALIEQPDHVRLLLVVDQFEEVFALCRDGAERRQFIDALMYAVEAADGRTVVLPVIRSDFVGRCADYSKLAAKLRETVLVGPLSQHELRQVIERPAKLVGLRLQPGLVETIIGDVADEPGALPLLSHALVETWERRRGHTLTVTGYADSGGVSGAIAQTADTEFGGLSQQQQAIARGIFLRLTELGEEGTQDTRRRVPPGELIRGPEDAPAVEAVLGRLASARLITVAEATVEVAHEALIREWPALRGWLEEDREGLRTHRHLTDRAQEWERIGREPGELYRGARLAMASEWAEQHADRLNPLEREFLDASQRLAWSEEAERQRRRQQIMVGLSTALAVTLILAVLAVQQWRRAQRGEQQALRQASAGLAARAVAELEGAYPERGVLLALQALEQYPYTPEAQLALAQAVRATVPFRVLPSPGTGATTAAWSPDGERLAAVAARGTIVIWDVETGQEAVRIPRQATQTSSLYASYLAWSPSGDRIAVTFPTAGWLTGMRISIRDAATGGIEGLINSRAGVASLAWSPDGRWILAATAGAAARVWDVSTGAERLILSGHADSVTGASWSPGGDRIVTASMDGTARVWDAETGAAILTVSGHNAALLGACWSPDGQQIATAGADGTARVWNASSGEALLSLMGHTGEVRDVAWSPGGTWIATAGADGAATVWDATTGMPLFTQPGLARDLQNVAWSPAADRLATSGRAFIRVWDFLQIELALLGHSGDVRDSRWSPDGTRIVTAGADGTARVWSATTAEPLLVFSKHEDTLHCASWSPSGDRVVSTGADGAARIWDALSGEELTVFSGHIDDVWHAEWSPDGRYVVSGGADQHARVWEAESGVPTGFYIATELDRSCSQWSPDGKRIVTASSLAADYRPVTVWDLASRKRLVNFENHEHWTCAADWSPGGERVVSAGYDATARVWDSETGEQLLVLLGHRGVVHDADWSPDGKRIVTGDDAGEVMVWDAASGKEIDGFSAQGAVLNVDWSPDGRYIVASGLFNPPLVRRTWLSTEDLIAHARECCVSRELTPEEREQFALPAR